MAKPTGKSAANSLPPAESPEVPDGVPKVLSRRIPHVPSGYACAPPPPPPPEYLRVSPPIMLGRPEGWVCRRCTEWWNWHPYRPPTEQELDAPCAECRKTIDAEERAVEVNRLLLARLSDGASPLAIPTLTVATAPARRQRKMNSELLSKKEAARRLGVDRATTLEGLIAAGDIKTVPFNGRVRIPLAEVERILNEGIATNEPQGTKAHGFPRRATYVSARSPGDEIRKLKIK